MTDHLHDQSRAVRALIPVTMDHADLLLAWRNDPVVRQNSWNQEVISVDEHRRWLQRIIKDPKSRAFIILNESRQPIGTVRFDVQGDDAEINITIAQEFRGYGYGTSAIEYSCRSFLRQKPFLKRILARIKEKNEASLKAFKKAGFVEMNRSDGVVHLIFEETRIKTL